MTAKANSSEKLAGIVHELNVERRTINDLHPLQESQITAVAALLQQFQTELKALHSYIDNNANLAKDVKSELSHQLLQLAKNKPDDAILLANYQSDLGLLRKRLADKEDEIEQLRVGLSISKGHAVQEDNVLDSILQQLLIIVPQHRLSVDNNVSPGEPVGILCRSPVLGFIWRRKGSGRCFAGFPRQ